MATTVLTIESAQKANLRLVEGDKGQQSLYVTLVNYRRNRRSGTASTKNRSEVSGSGKKLWNQKGTGNARMGSIRSPIWRGGGIVFGPRPRDYHRDLPRKIVRLALRRALTLRIADGDVLTIPSISIPDGKTKSFLAVHRAITDVKKVVYVSIAEASTILSIRNVPNVRLISPHVVNAEHLLDCDKVILTPDALEVLVARTQ
jgi:large subunit ribosomal protein L4